MLLKAKGENFQEDTGRVWAADPFSETFHGFLNHYSRMIERLIDFVTILALETSCEASVRIMQAMN